MTFCSAGLSWKVLSVFELSTMNCRLFSIHHAAERFDSLAGERITRLDVQRFLKGFHRRTVHLLAQIGAAQIVVRKMAWLVAAGLHRLLQPGDGFILGGAAGWVGPRSV